MTIFVSVKMCCTTERNSTKENKRADSLRENQFAGNLTSFEKRHIWQVVQNKGNSSVKCNGQELIQKKIT